MYPLTARRALFRRLDAVSKNLPGARSDEVEALHRARVASRRLRAVLAVLTPEGKAVPKGWRKAARRVRTVTRALGGVRELDVALGLLDELLAAHPNLEEAITATRASVDGTRIGRHADMRDALDEVDLERLGRRLDALLRDPDAGAQSPYGLRRRVLEGAGALDDSVRVAGALFALDRLHEVRISAKKLRYTLELVEELLHVGTKRVVDRLRGMQDLLGRMHDLAVLGEHARRAASPGPGAVDVRSLVAELDAEIHELHAAYLRKVGVLAHVTDGCRDDVVRRLDAWGARRQVRVDDSTRRTDA
jgi:CHAD domain-containing protein